MKRLYIGGLGHTVSEKDLKDRFGKFGDVSDVEIIRRKDEQGRKSDENQINFFFTFTGYPFNIILDLCIICLQDLL